MRHELNPVSAEWRNVGIALGLMPSSLDRIQAENSDDPSACLTMMVMQWLKRNYYNVKRFGEPTWQRLVKVVGNSTGGANIALAREIARMHRAKGMSNRYICCTVGSCTLCEANSST